MADELAPMRELVSVAMRGGTISDPSRLQRDLLVRNHLEPLAYKLGFSRGRDEYAASLIAAARRSAAVREIASKLLVRRVWAAPIKGFAFATTIYSTEAERPMNDVDLLIPVNMLADAIRTMQSAGYERVGMERKLSGYYHAIVFQRGSLMIELHRHIMQHHRTRLRIGEVWDRATPDANVPGLYVLDAVDQLLLCILHVARHELAVPAINYVDVFRAHDRLSSEQRVLLHERAREARVTRAVTAVLAMTDALANGAPGAPTAGPGSSVLPSTDDVLRGVRPARARQIAQKLFLTQGPREIAGLGYVYLRTYLDGRRRTD